MKRSRGTSNQMWNFAVLKNEKERKKKVVVNLLDCVTKKQVFPSVPPSKPSRLIPAITDHTGGQTLTDTAKCSKALAQILFLQRAPRTNVSK